MCIVPEALRRRYGGSSETLRRQHLNVEDEIQEIKSLWKVCGDAYDQQHNG